MVDSNPPVAGAFTDLKLLKGQKPKAKRLTKTKLNSKLKTSGLDFYVGSHIKQLEKTERMIMALLVMERDSSANKQRKEVLQ